MSDSKQIINQVTRDHVVSTPSSPTAAGRKPPETSREVNTDLVDTINQVFALFRVNYHNQYYAAFNHTDQLNQAKRLWLEALSGFSEQHILLGAKQVIETSEYLPTLSKMIDACHNALAEQGLPSARDAYIEACNARSPRSAQAWRHPAVYFAGRDAGWFYLDNHSERETWPVFEQHYRRWCQRALAGETLEIKAPAALEKADTPVLSQEERLQAVRALRASTGV